MFFRSLPSSLAIFVRLERMQDPLDAYKQAFTCPFCQTKFSKEVKLIPDCGSFICGACNDELTESLDESKQYKCEACKEHHVLPENGLPACKQIAGFLCQPLEKPLSNSAKKLKQLIENVQEELANLQTFDPRDYVEHTCVQLEHEVSQAAESAVKHIRQIETNLQDRIRAYRQRSLNGLETASLEASIQPSTSTMATNDTVAIAQEIGEFSAKWSDYFKNLNSLASDNQVEAAIQQTKIFQLRMKRLCQGMKIRAMGKTLIQFKPCDSFCSVQSHLGELVDLSNKFHDSKNKGEIIFKR